MVRFEGLGADAGYHCVAALSHSVANSLTDRTRWEHEIDFDVSQRSGSATPFRL